nr:hypothetical protein [uncultured Shinella sp.]
MLIDVCRLAHAADNGCHLFGVDPARNDDEPQSAAARIGYLTAIGFGDDGQQHL